MKNSSPAQLQMMTFDMFLPRQTVDYIKYGVPNLRTSTDGRKIGCPKLQKGF
jgi:hypothetical protein